MNNRTQLRLQCPLPKLDFEHITLGHGSGGILTNKLLESGVFRLFDNEILARRHDGARLENPGVKLAFSTDSYVVSPIFFPGGDIGSLSVHGTVNDLAMCGAIPEYLSLSFILEEGLRMTDLWDILLSIRQAADQAGIKIVTGDTKVVEKGKGDKIFINTSGIGRIHPEADIDVSRIGEGDQVIISGSIARHGMAIMSVREGLQFESTITSDSRPLHNEVRALLDRFGRDIHLLRDPTRGGVGTALCEVCRDANIGIRLEEAAIPVDRQVRAACEILGLDPLYMANEGVFLVIVKAGAAQAAVDLLNQMTSTDDARIIGEVVRDRPGKLVLYNTLGTGRVIGMLPGEQLPRIC